MPNKIKPMVKKVIKKVVKPKKSVMKKTKKYLEVPVVVVTYRGVNLMTTEQKRKIASYLRDQAKFVMKEGKNFERISRANLFDESLSLI